MSDQLLDKDESFSENDSQSSSVEDPAVEEVKDGPSDSPASKVGTASKARKKPSGKGIGTVPLVIVGVLAVILIAVTVYLSFFMPQKRQSAPSLAGLSVPVESVNRPISKSKSAGSEPSIDRQQSSNREATSSDTGVRNQADYSDNVDALPGTSETDILNESLTSDIANLKQSVESINVRLNNLSVSDGSAQNVDADFKESLNSIWSRQDEIEMALKELKLDASKLAVLEKQQRELKKSLSDFGDAVGKSKSDTGETKPTPPRVTGNDIEIVSVTSGFAFLRHIDNGEEFSLQIGEGLRGYGEVSRITTLGCIYAGTEKIEPVGGVCEL